MSLTEPDPRGLPGLAAYAMVPAPEAADLGVAW